MRNQDTVRIPLRARDGSVRAYAVVDAADAEWVNQWTWHLASKRYAARSVHAGGRRLIYLHRELLGLMYGDRTEGDHVDRDKLNNRRSNLRPSTRRSNSHNLGSRPNSTSEHRGVAWDRKNQKWRASIALDRKMIALGRFSDEADAAGIALTARLEYMPGATD